MGAHCVVSVDVAEKNKQTRRLAPAYLRLQYQAEAIYDVDSHQAKACITVLLTVWTITDGCSARSRVWTKGTF